MCDVSCVCVICQAWNVVPSAARVTDACVSGGELRVSVCVWSMLMERNDAGYGEWRDHHPDPGRSRETRAATPTLAMTLAARHMTVSPVGCSDLRAPLADLDKINAGDRRAVRGSPGTVLVL